MNERKNLDRLFQEKFKDFESEPNEKVWQNIEAALKEEKEDRKIIPFWFRLSGIAAALLIGLFAYNAFFNSDSQPKNSIVNDQNSTKNLQGSSKDAVVDNGNGFDNTVNSTNNTQKTNAASQETTTTTTTTTNPKNTVAGESQSGSNKTVSPKNTNALNNTKEAVANTSQSGLGKTASPKNINTFNNTKEAVANTSQSGSNKTVSPKNTNTFNNTKEAVANTSQSGSGKRVSPKNTNALNNTKEAVANTSQSGSNKTASPKSTNTLNNTKEAVANTSQSGFNKTASRKNTNTLNNTKEAVANASKPGSGKTALSKNASTSNTAEEAVADNSKSNQAKALKNTSVGAKNKVKTELNLTPDAVAAKATKDKKSNKAKSANLNTTTVEIAAVADKTKNGKESTVNGFKHNNANQPEATTKTIAAQENNTIETNPTSVPTQTIATPDNAVALDKKEEIKTDEKKLESTAIATVEPNALEELLLQNEKEKLLVAETKLNRWQITSSVAPIYFSSTANGGSAIDKQFADNSKTYDNNMSFGVGVNYAVNKKISIRTGVNKFTLGYNTNDVTFFAGLQGKGLQNVTATGNNSHIEVVNKSFAADGLLPFESGIQNSNDGYISQKMGYVEVPMEMSYKLVDKKFGITVIGGLSTLFLSENKVSVVSSAMSSSLGEANNLNDIHFSSNIGLGFKYSFWKSFELNFEPMFKYQLNTFTNDVGNFKPYFIGLYSGLSFQF